jgi:hypothetical protein
VRSPILPKKSGTPPRTYDGEGYLYINGQKLADD